MSVMYVWLLTGVLFLAAEALGVSGIGLLFAGLGATVVGILLYFGQLSQDDHIYQFVVFFSASALWAAILWKPLQRFRLRGQGGYSNIIGETAFVGSTGLTHRGGEVTWSGTIMKAQIAPDTGMERLEPGAQVIVVDIKGATLIVKPK